MNAELALSLGPRDISPREFDQFRKLIADSSGIHLADSKRQLLVGRLARRVRELGLSSFGAYYRSVCADASGEELVRMLDLVSTNETHFFREPVHFLHLEREIIPMWRKRAAMGLRHRIVRVWSAACSTGEEPYSLAMTLLSQLHAAEGWHIDILASDISTRALAAGSSGTWRIEKSREIPPRYLKRYMRRSAGAEAERMTASDELRRVIRFQRINLSVAADYPREQFDLVFCRNVLIYFNTEGRNAVVSRLTSSLVSGGSLFMGHAESLHGGRPRLRAVAPTIYERE